MANLFFPYAIAQKVAFNNTITPNWNVTEQSSASGRYRAFVTQTAPKYVFSYTCPCLTEHEFGTLTGFYNRVKGQLITFLFSDPLDSSVKNELLIRGEDGKYQLFAPLGDYVEAINYAEVSKVTINGLETQDYECVDGVLTVPAATNSDEVRANYRYYWRVHFADNIVVTNLFYNAYRITFKLEISR